MTEYITEFDGKLILVYPRVIREEIVRCRDCEHYREHEFVLVTDVSDVCLFWADGVKVAPDGFCAWAVKRKEGGE